MTACPESRELERFNNEELTGQARARLAEHVRACAACLRTLEGLNEDADTTRWRQYVIDADPQENAQATGAESAVAEFLERIASTPPPAGTVASPVELPWPTLTGYEILGFLGSGGMGVVYKARDLALDRVVALKMVSESVNAHPEHQERFLREAKAIASLKHANIVQIHEVGEIDGKPYLSLEYEAGGSLARKLDGIPWPAEKAAALVRTLALAIDAAHQQHIIHRDLKPGNILFSADGTPKLTDFGLAKHLEADQDQTRSDLIAGTPSYMAPEQANSSRGPIGPATDIYSLGILLYELLTGRPPFRSETTFDTLMQVLHVEPVSPRRLNPNVSRDLETICLKCLAKEPGGRYRTASDLAEDLRRTLAGEPIVARPIGAIARGWRWCRRKPVVASLLAAVAASLLIGTAVSLAYARLADKRATDAEYEKNRADELGETERQAREDAQRAEKTSAQQAELALDSLRQLIFDIQDQLEEKPDTQKIRLSLLKSAIDRLELAKAIDPNKAEVTLAAATAESRLGDIYASLGRSEDGLKHYGRARELFAKLAQKRTETTGARHGLAIVLNKLGNQYSEKGQFNDALKVYQETLSIRETLAAQEPEKPVATMHRANSHEKIARTLQKLGDGKQARVHYEKAIALFQPLLEKEPANLSVKKNLAVAYDQLGSLYQDENDLASADAYYKKSKALRDQLEKSGAPRASLSRDQAAARMKLGELALAGDKAAEALPHFTKGLETFQDLLRQDADNVRLAEDVARAHAWLGDSLRRLPRPDFLEASKHYVDALNGFETLHKKNSSSANIQWDCLMCYYKLGRLGQQAGNHAEAIPWFQKALDRGRTFENLAASQHNAKYRGLLIEVEKQLRLSQMTLTK